MLSEVQHAVPFITGLGILFKALLRNKTAYGEFTTKFAICRFDYIELQMAHLAVRYKCAWCSSSV